MLRRRRSFLSMVAAGSLLLGGVVPSAPALAQGEVAQGSLEKSAAAPATVAGADGLEHPSIEPPDETPTTSLVESDLAIADVVPEVAPLEQVEPAEVRPEVEAPVLDAVESRAVAVDGANLVAVTWDGPAPERIEARSLSTSGDWSVWEVLELDPDEDGNGGGTDPWWTGGSATVEVRSWSDGQPADDRLTLVAITTEVTETDEQIAAVAPAGIGSASSTSAAGRFSAASSGRIAAAAPAAAEPAAAAAALAPSGPVVISRAQWGADPALLRWTPEYASTTLASVVHHTAGSNTYTPAQSAGIVRGIYTYHSQSRGWGDIGYNVLVDQYGQIFEGRAGGLTLPAIGAHAGGFNSGTFGVSMMGDYSTVAPSAAMKESVARIIAWRMGGTYRFNMWSVTTYTTPGHSTSRFSPGQQVGIYGILAHRDVAYTSCPGNAGYAILPAASQPGEPAGGRGTDPDLPELGSERCFGALGDGAPARSGLPGGTAAYFDTGYTLTHQRGSGCMPSRRRSVQDGWPVPDSTGPVSRARSSSPSETAGAEPRSSPGHGRSSGPRRPGAASSVATFARHGGGRAARRWLAYPTSNQAVVGDGRGTFIEFESTGTLLDADHRRGRLVRRPAHGMAATGGATGSLGYPNRTQQPIGDGRGSSSSSRRADRSSGRRRRRHGRSAATCGRPGGVPEVPSACSATRPRARRAPRTAAVSQRPSSGERSPAHRPPGLGTSTGSTDSLGPRTGGTNGYLGYPDDGSDGLRFRCHGHGFEAGVSVVASARTGAREIWGPLRDKWRAAGGASTLGIPDADPVYFTGVAGRAEPAVLGGLVSSGLRPRGPWS